MQDGNGSWSGCAFLPACNRFLPFRHLLPWLLAHLQMPPSGQADSGTDATFKFLETLGKATRRLAALFKRTHEVRELTNLCKKWPRAIPLLAWELRASFAQHVGFL